MYSSLWTKINWIEVAFIFNSTALAATVGAGQTVYLRLRRDKEIPPKPLITAM